MKAGIAVLVVIVGSAGLFAPPHVARAQEILLEGPLAGAPAVRRMVLYREGRFFVTPTVTFTILDTYRRHVLFGVKAEYNIFDWLSVGIHATGGFGWRTGIADQVNELGEDQVPGLNYDLNFPLRGELDKQLGQLQSLNAIEARLIPLRGKFSLFGKLFLAMDVYANLGLGIAVVKERGETDCSEETLGDSHEGPTCPLNRYLPMKSRAAFGPSFGAGVGVYFTEWIGLNLEYRSTPFTWNQSGTDEFGRSEVHLDRKIDEKDRRLAWNHMVTLGCTVILPVTARRTD